MSHAGPTQDSNTNILESEHFLMHAMQRHLTVHFILQDCLSTTLTV